MCIRICDIFKNIFFFTFSYNDQKLCQCKNDLYWLAEEVFGIWEGILCYESLFISVSV